VTGALRPSPTVTVELVPIDQLHPDPANPRRISEEELYALERSIRQFGFVQPVLAVARIGPSSAATSASLQRAGWG
jgi:hypothetical protein